MTKRRAPSPYLLEPEPASYWQVPREWPGETFFLLAGGGSLRSLRAIQTALQAMEDAGCAGETRYGDLLKVQAGLLSSDPSSLPTFDPESIRGYGRIIAINDSYLLCPWADILYCCDGAWWRRSRTVAMKVFTGKYKVSMGTTADGFKRIRHGGVQGLSKSSDAVAHGTNSGYQAINLAYLFGASRIVLLGYDMHCAAVTHWHGGYGSYDEDRHRFEDKIKRDMLPRFQSLVDPLRSAGVEVIQCSPGSSLVCWPYRPLEDVLAEKVVPILGANPS